MSLFTVKSLPNSDMVQTEAQLERNSFEGELEIKGYVAAGKKTWKASRGRIELFPSFPKMVFTNSQFDLLSISSVIPRSCLSGVPNRSSPMWSSMTPPKHPKSILQSLPASPLGNWH